MNSSTAIRSVFYVCMILVIIVILGITNKSIQSTQSTHVIQKFREPKTTPISLISLCDIASLLESNCDSSTLPLPVKKRAVTLPLVANSAASNKQFCMVPRTDLYPNTTIILRGDSMFAEEDLQRYCDTLVMQPISSRANHPYYGRWCNGTHSTYKNRNHTAAEVRQEKTPWVLITRNKWIAPHGDLYDCQWGTDMSIAACSWHSTKTNEDLWDLMYSGFCPIVHSDAPITRFNYTASVTTAIRRYNKIFVLAQPWSDAVGHFFSELAPTLWTFIDVLRTDPSIAIYTTRASPLIISFLNFIGIESNRILSSRSDGYDMFAPVAIWPMRSIYMRSYGLLLRAATHDLQNILQRRHPSLIDEDPLVLVLTRNGRRPTPNWADLVDALVNYIDDLASRPNAAPLQKRLRLQVFSDAALPPFEEGAKLFFRAHLIVATHGAGIGNILFTKVNKSHLHKNDEKPATLIEIHNSRPITPHPFLDMAEHLGMRYLGMRPDKLEVNVSRIIQLIDQNRYLYFTP
jgi:hypothetical protein